MPNFQPPPTAADPVLHAVLTRCAERRLGPEPLRPLVERMVACLELVLNEQRRGYALRDPSDANLQRVLDGEVLPPALREGCARQLAARRVVADERFLWEFAVARYPRRVQPTLQDLPQRRADKERELGERLATFAQYRGVDETGMKSRVLELVRSSPDAEAGENPRRLLDLAAEFVAAVPLPYLWTVHDDLLRRMLVHFEGERCFVREFMVRGLGGFGAVPGSTGRAGRPVLALSAPTDAEEELRRRIRELGLKIGNDFRQRGVGDPLRLADALKDFATMLWLRSSDGVHRYCYEAPFRTWAASEARAFEVEEYRGTAKGRQREAPCLPEAADSGRGDSDGVLLGPGSPRLVREAYRFVRTTFFGTKRGLGREQAVAANESVRQIIDELFEGWMERGDDGSRERIVQLAARTGRKPAQLYTWCFDLRARMETYLRCRCPESRRPTNEEVVEATAVRARGAEIAAMAKTASARQSGAWAFAAYTILRPAVYGGVSDPWSFTRVAAELLNHWLADGCIRDAIAADLGMVRPARAVSNKAAEDGVRGAANQADEAREEPSDALASLMSTIIEELLATFGLEPAGRQTRVRPVLRLLAMARRSQDRLRACEPVIKGAVARHVAARACESIVASIAGAKGPHVGVEAKHWIIPAWFVAVIEKLDDPAVLHRLTPSSQERPVLEILVDLFRQAPA